MNNKFNSKVQYQIYKNNYKQNRRIYQNYNNKLSIINKFWTNLKKMNKNQNLIYKIQSIKEMKL